MKQSELRKELVQKPDFLPACCDKGLECRDLRPGPEEEQVVAVEPYEELPNDNLTDGIRDWRSSDGSFVRTHRFRVLFRDANSLRRTVGLGRFAEWIGRLREMSITDIARDVTADVEDGQVALVTNSSRIIVAGSARGFDEIEGRIWMIDRFGPTDSCMDYICDWLKVSPDGGYERVATAWQTGSWVRVLGHGIVKSTPVPRYLDRWIKQMHDPRYETEDLARLPKYPTPLGELKHEIGDNLYASPPGPKVRPVIHEASFPTTLDESNLVGNIYFANYFRWQAMASDSFLYSVAPECYRGSHSFVRLESRVEHLSEAMPFDTVIVTVALKALHERGLHLAFEYHRLAPDGSRTKLAVGEHTAVWVREDSHTGRLVASSLPKSLARQLAGLAVRRDLHGHGSANST